MARPRILLADDHPGLLQALCGTLGELGEVVRNATDGQSLVQAAQRLKPDNIFTDIAMLVREGEDTMRIKMMIQQVLDALELHGTDCSREEVRELCPYLSWNEVDLAVDYLSRSGQLCMTVNDGGTYRVLAGRVTAEEAGS